jgi:hypothetical protein
MPPATAPLPARAWPRWPTLVALTLAVLGAHLVLLADGLPSGLAHPSAASVPSLPTASAVLTRTIAPDAAAPRPAAVFKSQVRWIAPPTAHPPALSQPAPSAAKAVAFQPQPSPAQPPNKPAPEAVSVAAAPNSEPMPDVAPPEIERSPAMSADPAMAPGDIRDAAPESTNDAPQAADNATVLAQATAPRQPAGASADKANTTPGPAQPPASAQLSYEVDGQSKGLNYSATGSLDWRNEGSTYSVRMEIRMFLLGSRVQTSQGELAATGLQPKRFGDKSRSERAAHFDRPQSRIRFSNNAPDAELLPGAQDRLSVFLQLAGLLNARPEAYPTGHSIDIPVAGTGGSAIWRFRVQDLATLDLPAGSLIARHLVREPREPHDTRVDIWLAPSLGHLPVRIRLTQDNGDVVDQRLRTLP